MDSAESLRILERYSLVILPALVVAEQFGIPLPAVPALLGVGALAAAGQVSIPLVLGAIAVAALTVDFVWYELGRRRGAGVLAKLCQMSLKPDSRVRRTEHVFARYGAGFILVAKFVPGLTTVVPPLAGIVAIGRARFALYELIGVLLWAGTWVGLGYFFSDAISSIALSAARLGRMLVFVPLAVVAGYVLVKYLRRRRSLRTFRLARASPEAARLEAGEEIPIIDQHDGTQVDPDRRSWRDTDSSSSLVVLTAGAVAVVDYYESQLADRQAEAPGQEEFDAGEHGHLRPGIVRAAHRSQDSQFRERGDRANAVTHGQPSGTARCRSPDL
jgi:membrane protein DedA with SNARE-associated domain